MTFVIVHFNTPELTTCLCGSIIKNHPDAKIVVFDNSDKKPFTNTDLFNADYIDNTKGQIINFDNELTKYPNRAITQQIKLGANFGSFKHTLSIQYMINNIDDNFILLDSDVLLIKPIDFINDKYICISDVYQNKTGGYVRCSPMLCYFNVKLIKKYNLSYFDETRMHALNIKDTKSMNYDTGASFYEDLQQYADKFYRIKMTDYIIHYGCASWKNSQDYKNWLMKNKSLWY